MITDQLEPYDIDDLDEQIADETLSCSFFLSSRLVGAMLDLSLNWLCVEWVLA